MLNIGSKIHEARKIRRMKANKLAELLGVSPSSVSNWEKGTTSPNNDIMFKLVRVLDFPHSFFVTPTEITPGKVYYRKLTRTTKTLRESLTYKMVWVEQLIDFIESMVSLPDVFIPSVSIPCMPENLTKEDIFEISQETRRKYNLKDGPISNMTQLLENSGIIIINTVLENRHIDAFAYLKDGKRPILLLNTFCASAVRLRFDLAHELGHLILHRHLKLEDIQNSNSHEYIENQANLFAGALLLPEKTFLSDCNPLMLRTMARIKTRWKVSMSAMIMRLCALDLIDKNKMTHWFQEMARQGIRQKEPYDDLIPKEHPKLLDRALEVLRENGLYSKQTWETNFGIYPKDLAEITGLDKETFCLERDLVLDQNIKSPWASYN